MSFDEATDPNDVVEVDATLIDVQSFPSEDPDFGGTSISLQSPASFLPEMASEAAQGHTFLVAIREYTDAPNAIIAVISEHADDGSSRFLGDCGSARTAQLREFAESIGPVPETGFPSDVVRQIVADPQGALAQDYEEWEMRPAPASNESKTWAELPPTERQIVPGETPPDILANLTVHTLKVVVPPDWLASTGPVEGKIIEDDSNDDALCARTAVGYGSCVGLTTAAGTELTLMAGTQDSFQFIELVILDGGDFQSVVAIVGSLEQAQLKGEVTVIRVSGSTDQATLTIE